MSFIPAKRSRTAARAVLARPVIQWNVREDKEKGEKMNTFPSAKAAQHALRNNGKPKADKTHITASCQAALMDKMKNAYGYYWSYEPTELIADDEEFRKLDEIPPHPVYNDEGHKDETWYKNYGRYKAGAEGYEISNYGRVKNVKNRNILKGATVNEYRKIAMNGKFYSLTKLVAMTWSYNENLDKNTVVDHIKGSHNQELRDNYCAENMRWVSPSKNQKARRGQRAGVYVVQVYDEEMKLYRCIF